ncbi:hypothetical protein BH23ACT9_BH23ACT9_24070 [soil metagenome]
MSRRPALLLLCLALAACTTVDDVPLEAGVTGGRNEATASETDPAVIPGAPTLPEISAAQGRVADELVDARLDLVLELLDDRALDETTYEQQFEPRFRSRVPREELVGLFGQLQPDGPYAVVAEIGRSEVGELLVRAEGPDGAQLAITVVVTPDGLIEGLVLSPIALPETPSPSPEPTAS